MKKTILFFSLVLFIGNYIFRHFTNDKPSLDEKIGQMLMVGFKGFEVSDTSHIARDIQQFHLGGVVLFDYDVPTGMPKRNIENPTQIKNLISQLNGLSEIPLFVAVDQEGGRVARLKPALGFHPTVSAQYLGELNNADTTRHYARNIAEELHDLGFNVNFSPVVDLNTNPDNPVIGRIERSFGADPALVTRHASVFLDEFSRQNILGVLKHFPGHGSAWNDSHVGMADVTDTWEPVELEPYNRLIHEYNAPAVMTAHVFNKNLDPEWPATLSEKVQKNLLRDQLGFEGILFSDDMQMEAIRSFYGLETSITQAVNAGIDVIVFANNSVYQPDIVSRAVEIIKKKVENGEISEDRIDQAYRKIMHTKKSLKLMR